HRNGNGDMYKPAPMAATVSVPRPTAKTFDETPKGAEGTCPECHSVVEHEGGCMVCRNCGFSKCG
ncbi:MAG: hypothetical protein N2376_14700, partial [Clostridia bacterium]|nr:hypothetical protein [Clostridia bacterium]